MKRSTAHLLASAFSTLASISLASTSFAQDPAAAPAGAPPPAAPVEAVPVAPVPVAAEPAPAAAAAGPSDLDMHVRRFGIGYTGFSQVPLGSPGAAPTILTIPAIGVRYWLNPGMGVDVGLGFGWSGGSTDTAAGSTDKNSVFGFLIQGGVPFALANSRHVSFQVIPYLAFAHGQTSIAGTDYSGNRLEVGARAGFEVFFGFIGIPQLALNATVGAQFSYVNVSAGAADDTTLTFGTSVQDSPWDIFAGNVAARYYF